MANLNGFDASQVEPTGDFDPVPAGKYLAVITESEVKPTKSGSGSYLQLRFEILDGPTNGMYALQKELRKRIKDGLDWLSIKPLPASDGALPWFWHWDDRRYAVWWDSEGRPFVQGPNMLFTYSWKPRIDAEERGLLDAANCRAMFCHSDWYRDLIARNRGPAITSPIITWPYPIDPWPGEPLPDEYDLFVYSKNGHRPGLLEHLCEVFPRHVVLHYGQYKREQLFEAARRSRACVYLADDDHVPLTLQEILLAGCPVVGVRTGAPFIQDGVCVDRLPPGAKCVKNDGDEAALATHPRCLAATPEPGSHARPRVRRLGLSSGGDRRWATQATGTGSSSFRRECGSPVTNRTVGRSGAMPTRL